MVFIFPMIEKLGHVEFSNNQEHSFQIESKFVARIVYISHWNDYLPHLPSSNLPYCRKLIDVN